MTNHVSTDIDRVISDLGDLLWPSGWPIPVPAKLIDFALQRRWIAWEQLTGRSVRRRFPGGWARYWLDTRETVRRVLSLNDKEPGTVALVTRELRPADVYLDVGASVGVYVVPALSRVGSAGYAIAMEPRAVGAVVTRHAALNAWGDRLTFIPHAADADGEFSIDNLIQSQRIPAPTVVKIDVDGPEPLVLLGMKRLLASSRRPRLLSVELNDSSAIIDQMSAHGYRLREWNLSRSELERRRLVRPDEGPHGNGIFVPADDASRA